MIHCREASNVLVGSCSTPDCSVRPQSKADSIVRDDRLGATAPHGAHRYPAFLPICFANLLLIQRAQVRLPPLLAQCFLL